MCRWMGSHFHDWIEYNGVLFSIGFTRMGSHIEKSSFVYHCFFRCLVGLSNLKHAPSRELLLTALRTVFSHLKFNVVCHKTLLQLNSLVAIISNVLQISNSTEETV